jgi:hypothetical protein
MDESLKYYHDTKHTIYLKSELNEIEDIVQKIKNIIYRNDFISKVKLIK